MRAGALVGCALLLACEKGARFESCHEAANLGPSYANCDALVGSPLAPSTAWIASQAATGTCGAPPSVAADVCVTPGEMYASCQSKMIILGACNIERGMQFCEGSAWTVVCGSNDDCPSGFACNPEGDNFGTCQARCHASSDCGLCGLECKDTGICGTPYRAPTDAGV